MVAKHLHLEWTLTDMHVHFINWFRGLFSKCLLSLLSLWFFFSPSPAATSIAVAILQQSLWPVPLQAGSFPAESLGGHHRPEPVRPQRRQVSAQTDESSTHTCRGKWAGQNGRFLYFHVQTTALDRCRNDWAHCNIHARQIPRQGRSTPCQQGPKDEWIHHLTKEGTTKSVFFFFSF